MKKTDVSELLEAILGKRYDSFDEDDLTVDVFEVDEAMMKKLLELWKDPEMREMLQAIGITEISDYHEGYEE